MAEEKRYDSVTGQYTTGHKFDGIEELNTPVPKWWWWTLAATVVYSIGYCIVYPSIPIGTDYLKGVWDWSSRDVVREELATAREAQKTYRDQLNEYSYEEIVADPDLQTFAMTGGKAVFVDNCAPCHAQGGAGIMGLYPTLADDDWLWGGSFEAIQTTLLHGIRASDDDTRDSIMPSFGADEILEPAQIDDVAKYVLSLSNSQPEGTTSEQLKNGEMVFAEQCTSCHLEGGVGSHEFGAPKLDDKIWFYGGDYETVRNQISAPKHGVMPAWGERFDDATIKMLTVYVHSLGGGE